MGGIGSRRAYVSCLNRKTRSVSLIEENAISGPVGILLILCLRLSSSLSPF